MDGSIARLSGALMHIPRWFLWLLLYAAAVFSWIVYFEHGAGGAQFRQGVVEEWSRIWKALQGWTSHIRGS